MPKFAPRLMLAALLAFALIPPAAAELADALAAYDSGDYAAAYRELHALAALDDPAAEHALARMYFAGQGVVQDTKEGLRWEVRAATGGDAQAQFELGARYENGIGIAADPAKAVAWFRVAAEQGLPAAQYRLGLRLLAATDGEPDLVTAHMWLNLAAAKLPPGEVRNTVAHARDALTARMSVAQVRRAHGLAREWRAKKWSELAPPEDGMPQPGAAQSSQ
jgi:uncharacterized protein